ncbi:MAG: acyl carrier protein [Betaproteobacteria bacterium]|nr:acyl carrier protein [Betaproteobacteria bacterium]
MNELEREIAELIVQALSLEVQPENIDPTAPLYGDEYGLDSIDMLEIAVAVSTRYGVELRSDEVESKNVFASLRALANHVAEHRKQ